MEKQDFPLVLVWGEVLWDCLPEGLFLGGAPFNVGYHLHQLGHRVEVVSAVGKDFLGEEILRRMDRAGLGRSFLRATAERPTGWVEAELDASRNAKYRIVENVAWDAIPLSEDLLRCADEAGVVVYGSLAQRGPNNRRNLRQLLDRTGARKCMDANLRPPYNEREIVLELARQADLLKLNEEELQTLSGVSGSWIEGCVALGQEVGVNRICVTRGADGAGFWTPQFAVKARAVAVEVADTIGAGDAFMAVLVEEYLLKHLEKPGQAEKALQRACALGAFVASKRGSTPEHPPQGWPVFSS